MYSILHILVVHFISFLYVVAFYGFIFSIRLISMIFIRVIVLVLVVFRVRVGLFLEMGFDGLGLGFFRLGSGSLPIGARLCYPHCPCTTFARDSTTNCSILGLIP